MNKNLKKVIAIALALGTISAVAPTSVENLLITKAYASTDDNTDDSLSSLKLETSSGNSIKLYTSSSYDSSDKVDYDEVTRGDTYYAKTSASTINIDTDGVDSDYVRIFKGTSSSTKGKKENSDISLDSGTNTITVRIYSSEPDSSIKYSEDDDVIGEYKIKVKCTGSDTSDSDTEEDADSYDDIYLDKLSIAGESISLYESKVSYTYNVGSDVEEVTIKAVPEDEDNDTVTIDGTEVDDSDKYKKTVDLNKGTNKIEVEVSNDDDDTNRVYTLTITRGTVATTDSTSNETTTTSTASIKVDQWVQINGRWQYNDSLGTSLKNQWFFDRNIQKWYYLGYDGFMLTNTMVNGYKVGSDGAWIK